MSTCVLPCEYTSSGSGSAGARSVRDDTVGGAGGCGIARMIGWWLLADGA